MNNPQKRLIRYLFGIDDVAAGAIIGGSISAASAAGGVAAQARMNKVNRQWQERMWRKTNIRQEEMYNWYNSPQAKARQMIAAGLNPAAQSTTSGTASSTNSVPAPATSPLPFDAMAHAGDVVANSLQARAQLKHQKAVLAQQALEQARRFALDELSTLTDIEQKKAQTALFLKQVEVADIDKETKGFIRDMLEEFVNNGGNTYTDTSNVQQADAALKKAQEEYQRIINSNADAAEKSKIRLNLANAYQAKAQAQSQYFINEKNLAEIGKIDAETYLAENRDAREEALHQFELQIAAYSAEIGLNESERSRLMLEWERFIQGDNPNFWNMLGKFLYDNTSFTGSIGYSKSSK